MSTETEHPLSRREEHAERPGGAERARSVGAARLIPAVTFGLRAAVLAGVVIVSSPSLPPAAAAATSAPVLTTTALNGPISGLSMDETACCSLSN